MISWLAEQSDEWQDEFFAELGRKMMGRTWDYGSTCPGYYEVCILGSPIVVCDDWTQPVDAIWESYVVYPHGGRI